MQTLQTRHAQRAESKQTHTTEVTGFPCQGEDGIQLVDVVVDYSVSCHEVTVLKCEIFFTMPQLGGCECKFSTRVDFYGCLSDLEQDDLQRRLLCIYNGDIYRVH